MAFKYQIKINNRTYNNVNIGFTTIRDWEEAYDSGNIMLVFENKSEPIMPLSYVSIEIFETSSFDSNVILDSRKHDFLVISDKVEQVSKIEEFYNHNITFIEYTYNLENYLMSNFAFSRNLDTNRSAKFEYFKNDLVLVINDQLGTPETFNTAFKSFYIPTLNYLKENYNFGQGITFEKCDKGLYANYASSATYFELECDVFIRTNAPIPNNYHILSNSGITWDLPIGEWYIEYGIDIPDNPSGSWAFGEKVMYKFYVTILDPYKETIYDLIMNVRDLVSKYGGIESKLFFDETRLFNLNDDDIEYLRSVQAPQMYLQTATVKQILQFILSYVNALPRLSKNELGNVLSLEYFNKDTGEYTEFDLTEYGSEQNSNQIGTSSYSELKNVLPNDLNEATIKLPSSSEYVTVRGSQIQMTGDNFVLPLIKGKPLYKPVKLTVQVPIQLITYGEKPIIEDIILDLDLTEQWINKSEWDLKKTSTNFPAPFFSLLYGKEVGMFNYKTENLYWQEGDTKINLSDINGNYFQSNLIKSVIAVGIRRYFSINNSKPIYRTDTERYNLDFTVSTDIFSGSNWYKKLKFRVEYITSETLLTKQDKEDLSQLDFYSEMRHNQDETVINLMRASRKIYGDLQRSGNIGNSFIKYHTSLSDMYEVGQKDVNGYTITRVVSQYFNNHIQNVYTVTKNHNRISQATFIDQTYRWRDNYAIELMDRHEHYRDYIYLVPIGVEDNIIETYTKIYNKNNNFYKILFGILGMKSGFIGNTKATVSLVRTDGTIGTYEDFEEIRGGILRKYFNFIYSPLTSVGGKQGLIFKFGFKDNQVAGDGLTNIDGNWYNNAVRYTDNTGRFKHLDFYILNDYTNKIDIYSTDLENEFHDKYPLVVNNEWLISETTTAEGLEQIYFGTGTPENINENGIDSLIINKDTMTNININYELKIMSYVDELLIFGKDFFSLNYLVSNVSESNYENIKIYFYNNGNTYGLFEDLKVKSGYYRSINAYNNVVISSNNVLSINGFDNSVDTSWAIGDNKGNLFLACNGKETTFIIKKTHFRPNLYVIGEKSYYDNIVSLLFAYDDYEIESNIGGLGETIKLLETYDEHSLDITLEQSETISLIVYDNYSFNSNIDGIGETISSISGYDDYSFGIDVEPYHKIIEISSLTSYDDNISFQYEFGDDRTISSISGYDDYSFGYILPKNEFIDNITSYDDYEFEFDYEPPTI